MCGQYDDPSQHDKERTMSTSINITRPAGAAESTLAADVVRVYDPGVSDIDLIIDLQQDPQGALHRIGVATLTRDEAISLIRAIIREARIRRDELGRDLGMGLWEEPITFEEERAARVANPEFDRIRRFSGV